MISIEQRSIAHGISVLQVEGRLTAGRASQELETKVKALLKTRVRRVIIDLSGVPYLDSTGIGIVVMCAGKLKKNGGELHLSGAKGNVANTLALCSIDEIIPMFATLDQAISSFGMAAGAA